jgi:cytochrome c biogenesis protein CcmG/thiol:disulfide interchange protein DsbE
MRKWLTVVVLAAACAYTGFLVQRQVFQSLAMKASSAVGDQPGDTAPNFRLMSIRGTPIALSDWRGRGVWINFWATWCPYCRQELAVLEQEQRIYGRRVAILGVDLEEPRGVVQRFVNRQHLTYPVVLDSQGAVAAEYGVTKLPTSVFVTPTGVVSAVVVGAIPDVTTANGYLGGILPAR